MNDTSSTSRQASPAIYVSLAAGGFVALFVFLRSFAPTLIECFANSGLALPAPTRTAIELSDWVTVDPLIAYAVLAISFSVLVAICVGIQKSTPAILAYVLSALPLAVLAFALWAYSLPAQQGQIFNDPGEQTSCHLLSAF